MTNFQQHKQELLDHLKFLLTPKPIGLPQPNLEYILNDLEVDAEYQFRQILVADRIGSRKTHESQLIEALYTGYVYKDILYVLNLQEFHNNISNLDLLQELVNKPSLELKIGQTGKTTTGLDYKIVSKNNLTLFEIEVEIMFTAGPREVSFTHNGIPESDAMNEIGRLLPPV